MTITDSDREVVRRGPSWLYRSMKAAKRACCCSTLSAAGFVASVFKGEMHTLAAAVLLGMSGRDALEPNAEPQPPDVQQDSLVLREVCRSFVFDILIARSCRESGATLVSRNSTDLFRIAKVFSFDFVAPYPMSGGH